MEEKGKERMLAKVVSRGEIAPGIYSLWIETDAAKEAHSGQFLNVFSADKSRLLPRPISICEINDDRTQIRLVFRVNGAGTEELSNYDKGDSIEIMGPLGNGFPTEGETGPTILIGGGIGVAPLLQLAKELPFEKIAALGYLDIPYLKDEFEAANCQVNVATEEGTFGSEGTVMGILLENNMGANVIYACGPKPMLHAVKQYASMRGIKCYLSLEERMACGIGACLGCVCDTVDEDDYYKVKKRCVCKDGPVFDSKEVVL